MFSLSKLLKHCENAPRARFRAKGYSSCIEADKESKMGQNLENVVSQCHKELDWDRPKVLRAIELAYRLKALIRKLTFPMNKKCAERVTARWVPITWNSKGTCLERLSH